MLNKLSGNAPHHEVIKAVNAIIEELNVHKEVSNTNESIEAQIIRLLKQCGIPASIKGYYYLQLAIELAMSDPIYIDAITKKLYPDIARHFSTTGSRVERAIRHAVEVGFERGNQRMLESIFEYSYQFKKGKPTNTEFIAAIAEHLALKNAEKED